MNKSITPITAYISSTLVSNTEVEELLKCKIVGISAYKGYDLSFQILIEDSFLYSNINIRDLVLINEGKFPFGTCNWSPYHKCPENEIDVYQIDFLINRRVIMRLHEPEGMYSVVTYICSIDFYTANEQLHLLSDGCRLFLAPNHKINWKGEKNFPSFKKLK